MDISIAKEIEINLNHPKILNAIHSYIDFRIDKFQKALETCNDTAEMYRLQGKIQELRNFKGIRDAALAVLDTKG